MGGKPSKGTAADRRLKANKPAETPKPAMKPAAPKQAPRPQRRGR